MMKRIPVLLALALTLNVAVSTASEAGRCDATCKANKKKYAAIWKERETVTVNGTKFEVAVINQEQRALVMIKDRSKQFSIPMLESAASKASGCKAKDDSVLSMLHGDKNTLLPVKLFKKMKFLSLSLQC